MKDELKEYLAEIGAKGGKKSRRTLTTEQAQDMVRAREKKKMENNTSAVPAHPHPSRIEVYPAGKCYCPSQKQEIDHNVCAGCSNYSGHMVNKFGDTPVFFIVCNHPFGKSKCVECPEQAVNCEVCPPAK